MSPSQASSRTSWRRASISVEQRVASPHPTCKAVQQYPCVEQQQPIAHSGQRSATPLPGIKVQTGSIWLILELHFIPVIILRRMLQSNHDLRQLSTNQIPLFGENLETTPYRPTYIVTRRSKHPPINHRSTQVSAMVTLLCHQPVMLWEGTMRVGGCRS